MRHMLFWWVHDNSLPLGIKVMLGVGYICGIAGLAMAITQIVADIVGVCL